jgi:Protein of unknown function (DUF3455)
MMPVTVMAVGLILLTLPAWDQGAAPAVPAEPKPPEGAKLVLEADGKGDQIYTCKEENGQYSWTLKAPEAVLYDKKGKVIGRHFEGPTWELSDKSAVKGKTIKRADAPDKDAIQWLLLEAVDHSGSGKLSKVTHIQRLYTKGGKAPAGCDASSASKEVRSPYSATYLFYKSKSKRSDSVPLLRWRSSERLHRSVASRCRKYRWPV